MEFVRSCSAQTLRAYRSDLNQAFKLGDEFFSLAPQTFRGAPTKFDETSLLQVCRAALGDWVDLSPATRNRKVACLKSFLNWLYEEKAINRDLAIHLAAPRAGVRLPHFLSVDETCALIKSVRDADDPQRDRDHALILLLYGGGLRVSEACRLAWSQFENQGRVVRVKGKGSQERLVILPESVAAVTKALRAGKSSGSKYVFGDEPLSTRVAYEAVRSRGAKCGLLKNLHPHALRHSYATHLLSSGANLRTLQELLGHRSLAATQRYTHLGIDQLARTLEQFHPFGDAQKPGKSSGK